MQHISELDPSSIPGALFDEIESIWSSVRAKMRTSIPLRPAVCRFTHELRNARIATADELEHLLFSCSLGRLMVDVELRPKTEKENATWVVEATLCVLVEGCGYVSWHNAIVDVTNAVADMDPVMTAQTYAIRNVLRMAGFKSEDDSDSADEEQRSGGDTVDAGIATVTAAQVLADEPMQAQQLAVEKSPVGVESSPAQMPSCWITPDSVDQESVRALLLMDIKPIDYTERLMDVIKNIRNADPVMKKMKWSELFKASLGHEDPPTRLSGLSTFDMERLTRTLLNFQQL